MSDRFFYPLAALLALVLIGLASVWPQGIGARSPAPFGHAVAHRPPPPAKPQGGSKSANSPAQIKLDSPL